MPSSLTQKFPATNGIRWFNVAVFTITTLIAVYGVLKVRLRRDTVFFSVTYYIFSMLGITAGYHRLWSHRSYNASIALQVFLLFAGASAVQGSCYWWARAHRSHHRYTDTDLDPYNANRGFLWTHIGWIIFKYKTPAGYSDISDLKQDPLIQLQHRYYFWLMAIFGYILPTVVPGIWFNDWLGGLCFSAALRLTVAHHSTFCINSVAHWLGTTPYDDVKTPRDHFLSALLTMGEGYHNFHHQFPMDYRNAFLWYQYDPTKWFIALCGKIGLASHLRVFPSNEISKGQLAMKLKELKRLQDSIKWPASVDDLPVVSWETSGFIHDLSLFLDDHPGGRNHLIRGSGKEMTASFFGGVYTHSNAAHNLLSMMRMGVLDGGVEAVSQLEVSTATQRLYISEKQDR